MNPRALAARRLKEGRKAAGRIGATYETLREPDGRLYVTESSTAKVITAIRRFGPDVLICHRTCDYHRDHRYSGQLVLDASFVLQVPLVCPRARAMDRVPVILYASDFFTEGPPFRLDLVVDISRVLDTRVSMLLDHESQYLEWIPWVRGMKKVSIRNPVRDRKEVAAMLAERPGRTAARFAREIGRKYGRGARTRAAEAFQVSEYGAPVTPAGLSRMLPF
jgi:LmbE family N-acetylglucosaminyl deacetylase